ncbi:serine hydrolase [Lactococcus insecticola]|uniref:Serine hydrolase n=1 Tax=Pseudolactococcus insecticola TaxID=2709158 RepID=A0A6A0B6W0_9LACT|nr:serine hydrolase [Lactococcus insecticola]GFH40505.1 serine hydrolase [Lactococcus insecticola]
MQETIKINKINILQWLVLVTMVAPAFFTWPPKTEVVSSQTRAKADASQKPPSEIPPKSQTWQAIPKRAVTLTTVKSYADAHLTKVSKQIPARTHLSIKTISASGKAFELTDGTFIKNDKVQVASDVILSTQDINQIIYITKPSDVLYTPFTTYDNQVYSKLTSGQKLVADKIAKTNWGTYYQVSFDGGKTGWISKDSLTEKNPKLDKVQALLNQKYNKSAYSIYVKQLDSTFTAGVNQTEKMYSASLSKLPILYWTQEQINKGNASLSDQLTYNDLVNSWAGAFKPAGTGFLPKTANNQKYSLLDLINRTAKDSDNVGSNMLAYYETGKFSDTYQAAIAEIAGQAWDPDTRLASSEMVGRVLESLYQAGGAGFNALIGTDYDNERIPAQLPKTLKVAHKIGTADEFNHDAAIVFTSEPYILVIETNDNSNNDVLANISKDIYEVMK